MLTYDSMSWLIGLALYSFNRISAFHCRREGDHVYSAYFFAKFAPLACWGNFTGVSRGQRSHAYL